MQFVYFSSSSQGLNTILIILYDVYAKSSIFPYLNPIKCLKKHLKKLP